MTFLNFGALFGLAAVSIPIIIHLLNKMQVKEVQWAAMRFLLEIVEKNQRRLQMEDLLLLLLRCLLIALLVLALSRPSWQSGPHSSGSHQVTAVLIIDDSYSMGLTNGIQTRLQKAQAAAEQILGAFPSGSSAALFFAADNVQPVIAQPSYDFNLLRQTIRQAKLTDRSTDLSLALQQAVSTLQKQHSPASKEIYLVTDGQANGWGSLDQLEKSLAEIQKDMVVHIVLVGGQSESNLGVTDLRLEGGLAPINQPLRCGIEVLNGSDTEARDVRVSLSVDDQPAVDETLISNIPGGTARSVALFAQLRSKGYHTLTARIPDDRLPADDQRTVAVRAIDELKVLLVTGTTATSPSQSDDFFVRNALVPVPASDVSQYFIKTTTISAAQFGGASLDDYDAVFLLDVPSLEGSSVTSLNDYVRQGGGVVIFPGPGADLGFYNDQLGHGDFLPAHLEAMKGRPDQEKDFFSPQTSNFDHPITSLWNDPAVGTLGTSHFYAYYPLDLVKPAASGKADPADGAPRVIFHFAQNSDPIAVEHTLGLGRVVLFASTPTTAWNDLPIHEAFVPLVHRVLGSLIGRQDEGLNIKVGQKFSYAVSNDLLNKDVKVTNPGQKEPPRVIGQVTLINSAPTVQDNDTDEAGAYRLSIGPDPATILYFAAQSDPAESNLTPLSPDQLKALGQVADVIKWSPDVSLTPKLTAARVGRELWVPLLFAALILGTLETFLAQRFNQSK